MLQIVYGIARAALGQTYMNSINYVVCGGIDSCARINNY